MQHKGTKRIKTERLLLREFRMEDAAYMFENWASDPKVTEFLTWQPHGSPDVTKAIVTEWVNGYSQPNFYQWVIELKEISQPIGSISVVEIDEESQSFEIGYCIGARWWGKGITAEAFKQVIHYLFEELGVQCITAKHDTENPNSGKVMQKCGMQYVGTKEKAGKNNRGICDLAYYELNRN